MIVAELREAALLERLGPIQPSPERISQEYARLNDGPSIDRQRVLLSQLRIPRAKGKRAALRMRTLAAVPGADFSALAAEHSSGDVVLRAWTSGPSAEQFLEPDLAPAVEKLSAGEVSALIETDEGWELVRLDERWMAGAPYAQGDAMQGKIEAAVATNVFYEQLTARHPVEWFINVDDPSRPPRPLEPTAPRSMLSSPADDPRPTLAAPDETIASRVEGSTDLARSLHIAEVVAVDPVRQDGTVVVGVLPFLHQEAAHRLVEQVGRGSTKTQDLEIEDLALAQP